ncbi:copper amine oxidase N-terminal domain-containing protein [Desulforamulus putei]|uniref:copper amine oxidase N-terminal domain-containing protein n=1 Tax=Desulforamulus putei TaxID=74701 RepID=UPI002FDE3C37
MKRARKALSVLLTLAMLLGLLLPMGAPAMAVTKNTLNAVPTVATDAKGLISTLTIAEDSQAANDFEAGKSFIVTLPESVKFAVYENGSWVSINDASTPVTDALNTPANDPDNTSKTYIDVSRSGIVASATFSSERSLVITFGNQTNDSQKDYIAINIYGIVDGAAGDLKVNIDPLDSGVTGGDVLIGRAASGNAVATVLNVETIGESTAEKAGVIRITETTANALGADDELKLKLPDGFKWVTGASGTKVSFVNFTQSDFVDASSTLGQIDNAQVKQDGRQLVLKLKSTFAGTTKRGIIEIRPVINVSSTAKQGDVEVDFSGDNVEAATLVIAKYADYGVKVTAASAPEVMSGASEQELGKLVVEETVPGSLVNKRKMTIELPEWAKFAADPELSFVSGTKPYNVSTMTVVSDDRHKAELSFSGTTSSKAKFEVKLKKVNLQVGKTGDIAVKVYGSAIGATQEVVVGKAVAPVEVTATAKDVKLGLNNQVAGDIIIKETAKGAIQEKPTIYDGTEIDGKLRIEIDTWGVKFAKTPKVEVTEGNLEIENISDDDTYVEFKIKSESTKPSTIKISDVQFTVDRTVPVGPIVVKVKGVAVATTNEGSSASNKTKGFDAGTIAKVTPAVVVNPAPAAGSASFNIGSTVYVVDGVAKVMDAAPYIKNGRTYVPVRYLALALGVEENNIGYENGVVTLKKGDVTVKLTIGDKNLDNNGTVTAMDVVPEVNNGRTMLPARFVAEAFGAAVGYANGQVVISY